MRDLQASVGAEMSVAQIKSQLKRQITFRLPSKTARGVLVDRSRTPVDTFSYEEPYLTLLCL